MSKQHSVRCCCGDAENCILMDQSNPNPVLATVALPSFAMHSFTLQNTRLALPSLATHDFTLKNSMIKYWQIFHNNYSFGRITISFSRCESLRTHNCSHLIPLSNKNIFYRVRCVTMWNILWGRIVFMYIVCTVYLTCPLLNSTIAKYVPLILYHSCRFHVDKTHSLRCFPLLTLYWGKTILLFSFRCLHCDGCKRWVAADGCYLWRADVDECWEESPPWRKRRSRICSITSTKSTSMEN